MNRAVLLMLLLPHALALLAPTPAAAGMRARVKFTLHEGTTAAVLRADGVTLTARVVSDAVPCPDAVDQGKLCLDVDMPSSSDPAHIFYVTLHETNPAGILITEIRVPSSAATDSRWFVGTAEPLPSATPTRTPTATSEKCARTPAQVREVQLFYTDGSTVRLLVPTKTATPLPTPTPG